MEEREFEQTPIEMRTESVGDQQAPPSNVESIAQLKKTRHRRGRNIVILMVGLFFVFGMGAAMGGGLVYVIMEGRMRHHSQVIVVPEAFDDIERFQYGRYPRSPYGFPIPDIPRSFAYKFPAGCIKHGTFVLNVANDGPASDAGLEEGDAITHIDGDPIHSSNSLSDAIAEREPGDEIILTVFRLSESEEFEIEVTLGEHPDDEDRAHLGVWVTGAFEISVECWGDNCDSDALMSPDDSLFEFRYEFDVPFDEMDPELRFFLHPGEHFPEFHYRWQPDENLFEQFDRFGDRL